MDNTREKLIEVKEALGMCYKQGLTSECTGCTYREHNNVCMYALMEDALAVIKCLEEKQATSNESKWIPVTERLPRNNTYILVSTDCVVIPAYWHNDRFYSFTAIGIATVGGVTHWMPLPEPPKGE